MKRINTYITPLLFASVLLLGACSEAGVPDGVTEDGKGAALSLLPTVEGMQSQSLTRATNMFFSDKDEISIEITTSLMKLDDAAKSYTYAYDNGTFKGKDNKGFFFQLDNTSITSLTATWPSKESKKDKGIVLDQRKDADFQQADELEAKVEQCNIMPTAAPLPLIFRHKQSRLTFKLAGQNANGLYIESLILELKYYDADANDNVAGAFWAHTRTDNGFAELILPAGTAIKAENVDQTVNSGSRYMIGMVTLNGPTKYTGGIWVDVETKVELEAGYEYIVTLTPEGYNLVASFSIGGFNQDEGYIGIPIQLPTVTNGTQYSIDNSTQLVTLSRLLSGDVKIETVADWEGRTYTLKKNLKLSKSADKWYKPIKSSLANQLFPDGEGGVITEIKDFEGNPFSLFEAGQP